MGYLKHFTIVCFVLSLWPVWCLATDESQGWAYRLPQELMSPYCPGRALSECPSPQADELRMWILRQEEAGSSQSAVEAMLFEHYGDDLLQAPRAEGVGLVAYLVPGVAFFLGGIGLFVFWSRQSPKRIVNERNPGVDRDFEPNE